MIFLGDFATPRTSIRFDKISPNSTVLLNCEGYLTEGIGESNTVFNNINLYASLSNDFNLILNLSNNHIMDIPNGASQSLNLANKFNLNTVGAGVTVESANRPFVTNKDGIEVAIISGGWDIIGCKPAKKRAEGVAVLDSKRILKQVQEQSQLGRKVVVYLHWGYELEIYPQPTHRQLARNCIELGADIVLGCHSHCLQGYEKHQDKYIFYGLGNSIFEEDYYYNGKLSFPEFCNVGLAVDWDIKSNEVMTSLTKYEDNTLIFGSFLAPEQQDNLNQLSQFSKLTHNEYIKFFKDKRRKKKLLPVFHENDRELMYKAKRSFNIIRSSIISKLFKLGLKGSSR